MERFFLWIALILCLFIFVCLYRAVWGPTVFDRIIGGGFIGAKAVVLLILIGFMYKRVDMFIDLALVYAILSFIGTIIVSKYFIHKGAR